MRVMISALVALAAGAVRHYEDEASDAGQEEAGPLERGLRQARLEAARRIGRVLGALEGEDGAVEVDAAVAAVSRKRADLGGQDPYQREATHSVAARFEDAIRRMADAPAAPVAEAGRIEGLGFGIVSDGVLLPPDGSPCEACASEPDAAPAANEDAPPADAPPPPPASEDAPPAAPPPAKPKGRAGRT